MVAQAVPDFSGTWALEWSDSAAEVPGTLVVRQVLERTNVRGEPMTPFFKEIEITQVLSDRSSSVTHRIGVIGGVVGGIVAGGQPEAERSQTWHRVAWEDQSLVFEHGRHASVESGGWSARREIWSQEPDGRLRVAITVRGASVPATEATRFYRRQ